MKKRSKLDLAPDVVPTAKPQASGFGSAAPPDPGPEPGYYETGTRAANDTGQPGVEAATANPRNSRTLIFVSLAVVATAAVTLFMLKRR